jgi:sigma-B regulation protein RsbU (phosphoserine phosphatase)
MAGLRALIHARLPQPRTHLAALMRQLNRYLLATMPSDMFVTLFLAVLDVSTGEIHYVNAGHLPPLVLAAPDAEPMRFTTSGPVLGILPDLNFEDHKVRIEPGSVLAVFSDGVTEATDAGGKVRIEPGSVLAVFSAPAPFSQDLAFSSGGSAILRLSRLA